MSNVMKSIQDVKVSDVFDLTKVSFPYSYTEQQVRVAGRAIANYDRMVEEIAELKGVLTNILDKAEFYSMCSGDKKTALFALREIAQLAKLNQEGEG